MGAWSTSITGNDTAKDLASEYSAAFYKYDVDEALQRIDAYVRTNMFDESDEEAWCDYYYSLADFMWKKGILTDAVRDAALRMIDSGFGLELWEEAGKKTLESRKKKLAEFREKLLSPQPARKKIKPNTYLERIFEDGDIIAVQLQTAGKPYTKQKIMPVSEEAFHALDGKYVLMQLINCHAGWSSAIVPEVKDYWAKFRLFDGIYDTVPENIDVSSLENAAFLYGAHLTPLLSCGSSMFYFKRRNYRVLCNRKDLIGQINTDVAWPIDWGFNRDWKNSDSELVAAMKKSVICGEFAGTAEQLLDIYRLANRWRANHIFSRSKREAEYAAEEEKIAARIEAALSNGGKLYGISFGREIGIVTVADNHIDNLYIEGQYQRKGFGTKLLAYAAQIAGADAYLDVPAFNKPLLHMCLKLGFVQEAKNDGIIRMRKQ